MVDRGILFSGPMVRALIAGTKTQTRRALKVHSPESVVSFDCTAGKWMSCEPSPVTGGTRQMDPWRPLRYRLGDRLYVREHWRVQRVFDDWAPVNSKDRRPVLIQRECALRYVADSPVDVWLGKHRQGMHMPRWASRITLIVTDVRVERLQEISEADAADEGIVRLATYPMADSDPSDPLVGYCEEEAWSHDPKDPLPIYELPGSAKAAYRRLWNQINGPGSWDANPWVSAYTFTVHHQNIDQLEAA